MYVFFQFRLAGWTKYRLLESTSHHWTSVYNRNGEIGKLTEKRNYDNNKNKNLNNIKDTEGEKWYNSHSKFIH